MLRRSLTLLAAVAFAAPPAAAQFVGTPAQYRYAACWAYGCEVATLTTGPVVFAPGGPVVDPDAWWGMSYRIDHHLTAGSDGRSAIPHWFDFRQGPGYPTWDPDESFSNLCISLPVFPASPVDCTDVGGGTIYGTLVPAGYHPDAIAVHFTTGIAGVDANVVAADQQDASLELVAVTATPEPGSTALLGAGLFVLGVAGVRRRR